MLRFIVKTMGNILTAVILTGSGTMIYSITKVVRLLVDSIDYITGSGENVAGKRLTWHTERFSTEPVMKSNSGHYPSDIGEIDTIETFKKSTYPFLPDELIEKTKIIMASEFGTSRGCNPDDLLADDFQFVAPIVGPLLKKDFLKAFGGFKLLNALPDFKNNVIFQVDPMEPNRCWFFTRSTGTHTGPLQLGPTTIPATGIKVIMPPQASSMLFDEQGKCYTLTVGYTMDKRIGNTNGLGALFGILKAVGKPIPAPEGYALYTPSLIFEAFDRFNRAMEDYSAFATKQ